ncbi:MAG TPA: Hsp70 family protein, partial [Deltaproteobacteria bacterium]|nr:Hsp70 family protein [Deltaproteobacteria bacterium]
PQIEVTFDIDANGILHVSAKDKATGKEQSIRITSSSGLSEDDINRMIREAEEHEAEDRRRKEIVEAKNSADSLIYSTEKTLKEHGDKVDSMTRSAIENAIADLKEAAKGDDADLIRKRIDALTSASHKLAEVIYSSAAQAGASQSSGAGASSQTGSRPADDVVDAEFEEVKGDKR